jgi:hypothetical protein
LNGISRGGIENTRKEINKLGKKKVVENEKIGLFTKSRRECRE